MGETGTSRGRGPGGPGDLGGDCLDWGFVETVETHICCVTSAGERLLIRNRPNHTHTHTHKRLMIAQSLHTLMSGAGVPPQEVGQPGRSDPLLLLSPPPGSWTLVVGGNRAEEYLHSDESCAPSSRRHPSVMHTQSFTLTHSQKSQKITASSLNAQLVYICRPLIDDWSVR